MSIFVEKLNGNQQSSKYQYKIQLESSNNECTVTREYVSEFKQGECWGYNKFVKIDHLLQDELFIQGSQKYLCIKFYVRALTYAVRCRDLSWLVIDLLVPV